MRKTLPAITWINDELLSARAISLAVVKIWSLKYVLFQMYIYIHRYITKMEPETKIRTMADISRCWLSLFTSDRDLSNLGSPQLFKHSLFRASCTANMWPSWRWLWGGINGSLSGQMADWENVPEFVSNVDRYFINSLFLKLYTRFCCTWWFYIHIISSFWVVVNHLPIFFIFGSLHWHWDNGPLAGYVQCCLAHAPGMPGTFSPPPTSKNR